MREEDKKAKEKRRVNQKTEIRRLNKHIKVLNLTINSMGHQIRELQRTNDVLRFREKSNPRSPWWKIWVK